MIRTYKMKHLAFLTILLFTSCKQITGNVELSQINIEEPSEVKTDSIEVVDVPIATHFDFPVGKPNAKGYYNAQPFGKNNHLGDDWKAITGGNSDLGDPIYTIANGKVTFAKDIGSGWGKIIRITHRLPDSTLVESLYAHCDEILVSTDSIVKRGDQIGTIGTANGAYLAHLHFEMRDRLEMHIGGGYSIDTSGYMKPTEFIEEHR